MAIDQVLRAEIEELLVIYLNSLEQHQAGWDAQSILQTIADHHGEVGGRPARWKASDKVLHQSQRVRRAHTKLAKAVYLFGRVAADTSSNIGITLKGGIVPARNALCLIASRFYSSASQLAIADRLGLTEGAYTGRLQKGKELAAVELEKLAQLEALLSSEPSGLFGSGEPSSGLNNSR
ncbi:hypothetical protein KQ940_11205 [Marinobacterium sp. D7]|uniref:hypothetical protein n=1 Tax=Marinobacterium ramblicola TaxID=2849041 RepID=UPI001C2D3541|nr:hypothetical protein [Marinobacterium ramblicola]MBV1788621.1 hypothetical protein [Marinobacterium ramblicola]